MLAKLAISLLPFRRISPFLGALNDKSSEKTLALSTIPKSIKSSIEIADRNIPCHNKCLVLAIAGQTLLKRKMVPSDLFLGLKKDIDKTKAHAWLKCGDFFVTGKKGAHNFTEIAVFSKKVK